MASLQTYPSGNYHIKFRMGGRQYRRPLRTKLRRRAEAPASHVEQKIRLISEGRMTLPSGADVPTFLLSDGRLEEQFKLTPELHVEELFPKYLQLVSRDTLKRITISTFGVHPRHGETLCCQASSSDTSQQPKKRTHWLFQIATNCRRKAPSEISLLISPKSP